MTSLINFECADEIAVLTLNRPAQRNALSLALWQELEGHLDKIEAAGRDIAVVVLRSTGPVFCAGNDLKERGAKFPRPFYQPHIVTRLANLPQPIIVAVQGGCYTGGLELALTGDIILASESASFADTHGKFSMVPMWGMSQRLPRRVGSFKAREISFTGLPVSGHEAERIGLANKCVPDDQLETVTMEMAQAISGQSRHSVFAYKELYIAQADLPLDAGLAHEVFNTKGRGTDLEERVAQGFGKR
ncbi:enoyl-CoA hydratase/isomerase family protein [Sphingorhabdus sp.]|jgi:enoyl-CoA hydratase|uniref:enoyl-CoA hydratase/isomerase family protein n=1 Tax=Sphingorhabdus sp. TaxID=1902408 RepID=UPI0037CA845A